MESIKIKDYSYYILSSRNDGVRAVIQMFDEKGKVGSALFRMDDKPLKAARRLDGGACILYYRYEDLPNVVDMLRNEKPVYLIWDSGRPDNCRISTSKEPVGEGEEE